MPSYLRGDVVLVRFPFSDLSGISPNLMRKELTLRYEFG
jgi:hypothetical protein